MAGFVREVTPRLEAVEIVSQRLSFPWKTGERSVSLEDAAGLRLASPLYAEMPYPPYTRSLRDGFAVQSRDVVAATPGTPTFLRKTGEVAMGEISSLSVRMGEAVAIPTGAALPLGADAVVMLEDTESSGDWIEVRRGVQSGDNIVSQGEEIAAGKKLLDRGDLVDFRTIGLLSTLGVTSVNAIDLKINILSTGDEIASVETRELPPGKIRDVNGWTTRALLARYGFPAEYRGVVSDDASFFEKRVSDELAACDVLVLSGGSSVGVRDNSAKFLASLPEPGLLVRGINIVPGKPTLVGGCSEEKKLIVSLPGHPLSCLTVSFVFLLPLLLRLAGAQKQEYGQKIYLPLAKDLTARTGPEEFIPCRLHQGQVHPMPAKSGYISALEEADGLIRIPEDMETIRAGETAEVWTW